MSLMRTSTVMLRSGVRPVARITAPLLRRSQSHVHPEGNLGGPGGQQAPPPNPGGPEALKRNWVPIAGAAGVVFGGLYLLSPARPEKERTFEGDMTAASSTEIGAIGQPTRAPLAQRYKDKEVESLTELSGRKGGGSMGGFRAE
ncbi:hypothetical protein FALBO_1184 [Fusarium albosuccineum]|uniref:Uncharacterized protein n=1 Tax=Fusarium albosuccineum TaxID=1237068 RepID=A0A8H4PDT6_9HYPO|nr:hypothetical protein FALBO_1184 [Fusarium albosuccineum]